MKRFWLTFVALVLGTSGCAVPPVPYSPTSAATPTRLPVATSPATAAAVSTVAPTASHPLAPVRVVLVSSTSDQMGLLARPVDPVSLTDLPGYPQLDLQHHYVDALSPQGRLWALITWPSGWGDFGGVLHLIDLSTWSDTPTSLKLKKWVPAMAFSADGSLLAVAGVDDAVSGGVEHWQADLKIINPQNPENVRTTTLDFWPRSLQFSSDGQQLILYGTPFPTRGDTTFMAGGAPLVVAFAAPTGHPLWSLTLQGVKDGAYLEPTADDPKLVNYYTPGLAFSADGRWLYVAHAQDQLTAVDLAAGSARTMVVSQAQSLLDRLTGLTAGTAFAKGGGFGGADMTAVLAPDGQRLFVTGVQRQVEKDASAPAGFKESVTPISVQVIDPRSGERVMTLDTVPTGDYGTGLVVSPDGHWLYLLPRTSPEKASERPGLVIVDAASFKPVAQLKTSADYPELLAFAPDNSRAYLISYSITASSTAVHVGVLNTTTNELLITRDLPGGFCQLIVVPH